VALNLSGVGATGPKVCEIYTDVNFTIVVYSPTNITSLFYPVSKLSYFAFTILR